MHRFFHQLWLILTAPFRLVFRLLRGFWRGVKHIWQGIHSFFAEEPEDTDLPEVIAKTIEYPKGLLEHLEALRKHLLRAFIFLFFTTALSLSQTKKLIDFLAQPIGGIQSLQAIEVTEPIGVFMRVALLAGFSLALPYIAFELLLFAAPGLKRRSRILGLLGIPIALIFFLGGMAFAYYVMLPTALPFLINFMDIQVALRPSSFIRFVTGLLFWIGVAFEFPLVIYLIAGMGLIQAKTLAEQWRLAVVIIAVLAAAITPTIDPVNMLLVMGPMTLLYFLSIGLAYLAQRPRASH
jgi:sec-independent protein translocase protein TatC